MPTRFCKYQNGQPSSNNIKHDKIANNGDNTIIKIKAINLSIIVFLIYLLILPVFGNSIDFQESLIFYSLPCLVLFDLLSQKIKPTKHLTTFGIFIQLVLIFLMVLSSIFSINVGSSYYSLFNFITVILIVNVFSLYFSEKLEFLIKLSVGFGCIYASIFILNKIGVIPLSIKPFGDNFILQVWGHSNLSNFIIFPLLYLLNTINHKNYSKTLPPILFLSLTLFLTLSRSSVICLIIGVILIKPIDKLQNVIKITIVLLAILSLSTLMYLSINRPNQFKDLSGSRFSYWSQGIIGFKLSPLIGNGPNTFSIINRQNIKYGDVSSSTSHNSVIDFLNDNGTFFTIIFYSLVLICLSHLYFNHPKYFSLGLASLVGSLLDPSWISPGIFTFSLIIILSNSPILYTIKPTKHSQTFLLIISTLLFAFFISKTSSDFLFINKNYGLSLKFDPFNLNSRLFTLDKNKDSTLKVFNNEILVYQKLVETTPLPQSQPYLLKLIQLDPQNSHDLIIKLLDSLAVNPSPEIFSQLKQTTDNLNTQSTPDRITISISQKYIHNAITLWQHQQQAQSLSYFAAAANLSPKWSQFQVELANAYWHTNQPKLAIIVLTKCQKQPTTKNHCQQYLNQYQKLPYELPDDPIWIESIDNIAPLSH